MRGGPQRARRVAERLASCADNFLGAVLRTHASIDRDEPLNRPASPMLSRLAADQLTGLAGGATLALLPAHAGHRPALSLE
jgi:flagellar biosynthesis protein FlhG